MKKNKIKKLSFVFIIIFIFLPTISFSQQENISCNDYTDCPAYYTCEGGYCVPGFQGPSNDDQIPCINDSQCPDGQICELTLGYCSEQLQTTEYATTDHSDLLDKDNPPDPNQEEGAVIFTPQITIPGSDFKKGIDFEIEKSTKTIGNYIKAIHNYLLAIVGLLATIVLMASGIIWMTAGGNTERISQAKGWMTGALTGLVLMLFSYIILRIINPNLVNFKIANIENQKEIKLELGCCQWTENGKEKSRQTTEFECKTILQENGIDTTEKNKNFNIKEYFFLEKLANFIPDVDDRGNIIGSYFDGGGCQDPICCQFRFVGNRETVGYTIAPSIQFCGVIGNEIPELGGGVWELPISRCSQPLCSSNKSYGEACTVEGVERECYCFNENYLTEKEMAAHTLIYSGGAAFGEGYHGAPCGTLWKNNKGSTCITNDEASLFSSQSTIGGRDCGSGLWCYKK